MRTADAPCARRRGVPHEASAELRVIMAKEVPARRREDAPPHLHPLVGGEEPSDSIVEALGEGPGRGVLGDGRPAHDHHVRQLRRDLKAELGGLAPVEEDAV